MPVRGIHTDPVKNMGLFRKVCHPRCVWSIIQSCSVYMSIYTYSYEHNNVVCVHDYVYIDTWGDPKKNKIFFMSG